MASNDTLATFDALANQPPAFVSGNSAFLDTRNSHPCLDFAATGSARAVFGGVMPRAYASGGLTVYLHWSSTSGVTGSMVWTLDFERNPSTFDVTANSFGSAVSVTAAAPASAGAIVITTAVFTHGTDTDSIIAGDKFRLRVMRNADVGGDDMTGDAELYAVEVKET